MPWSPPVPRRTPEARSWVLPMGAEIKAIAPKMGLVTVQTQAEKRDRRMERDHDATLLVAITAAARDAVVAATNP